MSAGLTKDEIRRIMLDKLGVVYEDWHIPGRPFEDIMTAPGERREDARAFVIALVAALVGGVAEAIDRNNARITRPRRRAAAPGAVRVRALRDVQGYRVEGQDGELLGEVRDAYFDDHSWTVRYLLIADAGRELPPVFLSPHSLRRIDRRQRAIIAALTPAELRASPEIAPRPAISRAAEIGLLKYYGFPYYWSGRHRWGDDVYPQPLAIAPAANEPGGEAGPEAHLRSVRDFRHYTIHATDGEIGHVDDVLIEPRSWAVGYIVVDTRRWWPGARILLAPEWVNYVSWVERSVHVSIDRATIRTAPPYDRTHAIDRTYEARLHAHYGRPTYWRDHAA
jgi:uncharacterized protein YrrD